MRKLFVSLLALSLAAPVTMAKKQKEMSGNPIIKGWYADPEGIFMGGKYWIFPTFSAPYKQQLFFDAFSSTDLVHWEKHERVLEQKNIPWLRMALWAPSIIEANDKFYLFFGGNDVHEGTMLSKSGLNLHILQCPHPP